MKRLFVGVPISEEVKEKIKPLLQRLMETGADLNLVSVENLHFTLKFLGNEDESQISQIAQKLDTIASQTKKFTFGVEKLGVFPSAERISVVWIGAESRELMSLMKEMNVLLDYIRKNEHEEEIPHLTIARVKSGKNKEKLLNVVNTFHKTVFGKVLIDKIMLFESVLTPRGPAYMVVKEFLLRS